MDNTIQTTQEERIQAIDALWFLRDHPATNPVATSNAFFDGAYFQIVIVDKLSHCESETWTVYRGDEGWERFKPLFDEEYKDCTDELASEFQSVQVPYEDLFGAPWTPDHVEYWYETTFFVYNGNPYTSKPYTSKGILSFSDFIPFKGPDGGANTFEGMLIEQAKAVKEELGDFSFSKHSFITEEEAWNHSQEVMFPNIQKACLDEKGRRITKGNIFERNPRYLDIPDLLTNLRWAKWYVDNKCDRATDDYEINEMEKCFKFLDDIPKERLDIINESRLGLEHNQKQKEEKEM